MVRKFGRDAAQDEWNLCSVFVFNLVYFMILYHIIRLELIISEMERDQNA